MSYETLIAVNFSDTMIDDGDFVIISERPIPQVSGPFDDLMIVRRQDCC